MVQQTNESPVLEVSEPTTTDGSAAGTTSQRGLVHVSLQQLGEALTEGSDPEGTLDLLVRLGADALDADVVAIQLLDHRRQQLTVEAIYGPLAEAFSRLQDDAGEELARLVIESGSLAVADLLADPRTRHLVEESAVGLKGYLAVPFRLKGRVVGILSASWAAPKVFQHPEVELVSFLGAQAAVSVRNSRLFSALQSRLQELSGLYEISLTFGSLTSMEDVYGQLVERIARLLEAERCVILLFDEAEQKLVAQAPAFGLSEDQVRSVRLSLGEQSASVRVFSSGQPYLANDAQNDARSLHRFVEPFGDHSLLIVPMRVGDRTIGLIRASSGRGHTFTGNDLRLLTIFATQASVIVQNALSYQEIASQPDRRPQPGS